MSRDSYIVRIYNRPVQTGLDEETGSMTGIIEDAETGMKYTFHNMGELWSFMAKNSNKISDHPTSTN